MILALNYDDIDEESQTECESSDSDESKYHQSENKYDNDVLQILLLLTLERCLQKLLLLFIGHR